jgi:hypothetical protein
VTKLSAKYWGKLGDGRDSAPLALWRSLDAARFGPTAAAVSNLSWFSGIIPGDKLGGSGWAGMRIWRTVALKACVWGLLSTCSVAAQSPENAGPLTLHAYTNLVQIPTLVLGEDLEPVARIDEGRFFVSLDGGRKLRVTHARLEGDDPISLTILLDLSQSNPDIILSADQAIASLAPLSLHKNDEVSIYALDCQLLHPKDRTATDAAALKGQVDLVLQESQPRDQRDPNRKCQSPLNLWDSLVTIIDTMSERPGRRVILAVTDGVDRGSRNSWNALRFFAQTKSVAIFGLVQPSDLRNRGNEVPFNDVCQLSGGILLPTSEQDFRKQLAWAVTLIRGRYIVEFPPPVNTISGNYRLDVTISQSPRAFIRPTGSQLPIDDPAVLKDPTTVPSDPSRSPELGNRKILSPY